MLMIMESELIQLGRGIKESLSLNPASYRSMRFASIENLGLDTGHQNKKSHILWKTINGLDMTMKNLSLSSCNIS